MKFNQLSLNSRRLIVLNISLVAAAVYIIALRAAYPLFQNAQLTQPLASLQALFPLYYIAIILLSAAGILSVLLSLDSTPINIWLLMAFVIMLWYTPHLLAGTTYQLDGIACTFASDYIPEMFKGKDILGGMATYARQYPASFVLHWIFVNTIGLAPFTYLNVVFPLMYITLFVLFSYLVVRELLGDRVAFIGLLLALPGMHFIQIYPSPHALGILMTMLALVFVIRKDMAGLILAALIIVVTVYAHPISPLILIIFMASFLLGTLVSERSKWQITLTGATVFCFVLWLLLYTSRIAITPGPIPAALSNSPVNVVANTVTSDILARTLNYLFGTAFIFGWVYSLARDVYFSYAILVIALLVVFMTSSYKRIRVFWKLLKRLMGLNQFQCFFLLSTVFLVVLTILLGAFRATNYDLVERSLTVLIYTISVLAASLLFNGKIGNQKWVKNTVFSAFFIFFIVSFPFVSFSKDAYTSMPLSEKAGLDYVYDTNLLHPETSEGKQAIIPKYQIGHSLRFSTLPVNTNDICVFKMTAYYYDSMRCDFSFTQNQFLSEKDAISRDTEYDCIYVNRTTSIYRQR